jgi:hypothetical protein
MKRYKRLATAVTLFSVWAASWAGEASFARGTARPGVNAPNSGWFWYECPVDGAKYRWKEGGTRRCPNHPDVILTPIDPD